MRNDNGTAHPTSICPKNNKNSALMFDNNCFISTFKIWIFCYFLVVLVANCVKYFVDLGKTLNSILGIKYFHN